MDNGSYNVGVGRVMKVLLAGGVAAIAAAAGAIGALTVTGHGRFDASSGSAGVAAATMTDRLMANVAAAGSQYVLTSTTYPQLALQDVMVFTETVNALGNCTGDQTLDLSLGNVVTATLTGDGTWTITNPAASGKATTVSILLTNGGAFNITWAVAPKWPGGLEPTFTASGLDLITMTTVDGGTTWYASYAQDIK